jgi:hypothetical protein
VAELVSQDTGSLEKAELLINGHTKKRAHTIKISNTHNSGASACLDVGSSYEGGMVVFRKTGGITAPEPHEGQAGQTVSGTTRIIQPWRILNSC